MTLTDRTARINFAISRFQRELKLTDWDIRYDPKWLKKDHLDDLATILPDWQRRMAVVRLNPTVMGDQIDNCIAHELAHLVIEPLARMLGQVAAKAGKGGLAVIDWMEDERERVCEVIAFALTGVTYEPSTKAERKDWAPFAR